MVRGWGKTIVARTTGLLLFPPTDGVDPLLPILLLLLLFAYDPYRPRAPFLVTQTADEFVRSTLSRAAERVQSIKIKTTPRAPFLHNIVTV